MFLYVLCRVRGVVGKSRRGRNLGGFVVFLFGRMGGEGEMTGEGEGRERGGEPGVSWRHGAGAGARDGLLVLLLSRGCNSLGTCEASQLLTRA